MNNLNSLIIEGNVVRPGVMSEPAEGFKKYVFHVGVNRSYKNKNGGYTNEVSYFEIVSFNKMAEISEKLSEKGRGVRVVGRLKQDSWKDSDGKFHDKVYVVAEHIEYKPKIQDESLDCKTQAPSVSNKTNEACNSVEVYEEQAEAETATVF